MTYQKHSRRSFLGRIAAVCTLALVGSLRAGSAFAMNIAAGLSKITGHYCPVKSSMKWNKSIGYNNLQQK